MPRFALASLLAASILAAVPAYAQDTPAADLAGFNTACAGAQEYLLGDVPPGTDPLTVMTPLCACLGDGFKSMSQKDVDMLAADLRGEGTEEAHAAHGEYQAVEDKARNVLGACYASPEIQALLAPAAPPAATETPGEEPEPEAPAEPEPAPTP